VGEAERWVQHGEGGLQEWTWSCDVCGSWFAKSTKYGLARSQMQ
jgi:hypothetical protein